MATDKERRGIAQKLRDIEQAALKGETIIKKMSASGHLALISETIEKPEGQTLWGRLADIIESERTCHDFGGEEGTNGEQYDFACSACGFMSDILQPNYCPHCGAKVIGDEND